MSLRIDRATTRLGKVYALGRQKSSFVRIASVCRVTPAPMLMQPTQTGANVGTEARHHGGNGHMVTDAHRGAVTNLVRLSVDHRVRLTVSGIKPGTSLEPATDGVGPMLCDAWMTRQAIRRAVGVPPCSQAHGAGLVDVTSCLLGIMTTC